VIIEQEFIPISVYFHFIINSKLTVTKMPIMCF
jgi:hypothetical protein